MMNIMMICTSPIREKVMHTPWHFVTGMRINSLEQPENNPEVHGEDMKIASDGAVKEW